MTQQKTLDSNVSITGGKITDLKVVVTLQQLAVQILNDLHNTDPEGCEALLEGRVEVKKEVFDKMPFHVEPTRKGNYTLGVIGLLNKIIGNYNDEHSFDPGRIAVIRDGKEVAGFTVIQPKKV